MPAFFTLEITNYLNVVKKSHTSLPPQGTGITDSSHYGTLNKLSAEVRVMVYMNVLKFERTIKQPHRFLGRHPPMMAEAGKHIEVIDAALLRTCRAVYHDAVGILYGVNRFEFRQPRDIEEFAHVGLGKTSFGFYRTVNEPSHAVQNSPYGRLTMIRSMTLKLSSRNKGDDDELKSVLTSWSDFFYPPEERDQLVGFPALERLVLDLKDWELLDGDAHKLRVKPFLRKLRPPGGLKHLTLIGVEHEQNLRDFKHGFVKEGGTFRPASSHVKRIATTTVTHDDLPEVSMCVRAIVKMDKGSRATLRNLENAALART